MSSKTVETLSANGNSAEIVSAGGPLFISAVGDFSFGTLALQYRLTDGTWQTLVGTSIFTVITGSDTQLVAPFPRDIRMRLNLSGAISPSIQIILQAT